MKIYLQRVKRFLQLAHAQNRTVSIDQSVERGGEDLGFRPTELWLIGLSSCSMMTLLRYAEEQAVPLTFVSVTAEDRMDSNGDISAIDFGVTFTGDLTAEQKANLLQHVKSNCKVLRTVGPHIAISYIESDPTDAPHEGSSCTLEGGNCCT
ncbi:OsmC family protein [Paenibacillus sp. FA6]|uniref:OsmC family protein n=1 Tax=Paenibacillus sp. FA6 TaxID=3413029 RepID=UPI003F6589A7